MWRNDSDSLGRFFVKCRYFVDGSRIAIGIREMRILLSIVLLSASVFGQFSSLATSGDGSVVYFATTLRLKGSDQNTDSKIFVADESGVRLVEQRTKAIDTSGFYTWPTTNFYNLLGLSLSDDAGVRVVTAQRACSGGSGCLPVQKLQGTVGGQPATAATDGPAYLSADGRYALVGPDGAMSSLGHLVDLTSGAYATVLSPITRLLPFGRRVVSSSGMAVLPRTDQNGIDLITLKGTRSIATSAFVEDAVIDSQALRIAYTGGGKAAIVDVATGAEQVIGLASHISTPAISADGSAVTFIAEGQVWLYHGGATTKLTSDSSPITDAVLSGDGRVVYASTASGRLIKVGTATGEARTVIARTPYISPALSAVAGSAAHIGGAGFSEGGSAVEVAVDGQAVPILGVTATDIAVQIPWSMNAGDHTLTLDAHADSPFQLEPVVLTVTRPALAFVSTGTDVAGWPNAVAVHEDWSSLVTRESPAKVGEVVHLYATGLGPVTPSLADGQPGGANPPSRTVETVTCSFVRDVAGEVVWSGIGPGLVGIYQVDLRIPAGATLEGGWMQGGCAVLGAVGTLEIAVRD